MSRRRTRLPWQYDDQLQQFTTPSGVVTLKEIAELLLSRVTCNIDFAGPWTGWRMRQNRLIQPGASYRTGYATPEQLRGFNRWLRSFEGEQAQLEFRTEANAHRAPSLSPTAQANTNTGTRANSEFLPPSPAPEVQQQPPPDEPKQLAAVIELAAFRQQRQAR